MHQQFLTSQESVKKRMKDNLIKMQTEMHWSLLMKSCEIQLVFQNKDYFGLFGCLRFPPSFLREMVVFQNINISNEYWLNAF